VTGLFRERAITALVAVVLILVFFAVADHWYGFFMALWSLSTVTIAGVALFADRPKGYIQRVALAIFAVLLFGGGFGHLAYFANDAHFRPLLLWLIVGVELNDVFAFTTGRLFGRGKLCPNTSPNKTVAGSVGAFLCTTALVGFLGHFVFEGTPLDTPVHLAALGAIVSVAGQFGDLTLSSIKRDIGIKDTGTLIPGHGGLLDRFDSLLLAAPAVFHYVGYFRPGIGLGSATRILTGP
jgi:phosphatidate cytidylyltransferase